MEYAKKLFGAFQQLHTDAEFAGTGIGLATVQRIIHRQGDRICAKSEVGRGVPLYRDVAKAHDAMHALVSRLLYLTCRSGVCLPERREAR